MATADCWYTLNPTISSTSTIQQTSWWSALSVTRNAANSIRAGRKYIVYFLTVDDAFHITGAESSPLSAFSGHWDGLKKVIINRVLK